jgi:hypothetical protein
LLPQLCKVPIVVVVVVDEGLKLVGQIGWQVCGCGLYEKNGIPSQLVGDDLI